MLKKSLFAVFIVIAVVIFVNSAVFAADSSDIKVVFRKANSAGGALNRGDQEAISKFVSNSLDELVTALDYSEMLGIRKDIAAYSIKKKPSRYSLAYATAIEKAFPPVMDKVKNISDPVRKTQLAISLMILLADVETMELAPLGMSMFDDKNAAVRYWAVSSVASVEVAEQLKSSATGDPKLAAKILSVFDKMINEKTLPEMLNLIAGFADALDSTEADEILIRIADIRIKSYAKWNVKYELMDAELINSLCRTIRARKSASDTLKTEAARRFAQLYSCAIQRYILGFNTLDDIQKAHLTFVLSDVERFAIGKLLARPQTEIKQLVSSNNPRGLEALEMEHDSLLGTVSKPGRLAQELNFDYGKMAGKIMNAPRRISAPKPEVEPEV
jgi:hypothetical protein